MLDRRIGAQFFTLRNYVKTAEDFDNTCKKVSEIGYKTVQLSAIGDISAEEIRKTLDKYSLKAVLTHRGAGEFENDLDKLIDFHKTIGCDTAGLGIMPKHSGITEESLMEFIKKYNDIAEKLGKHNITFAYHNHAVEFAKIKGKYVYDILADETCPNFKFTLDVYWVAYSGINPAECIMKYRNKIADIHFKDLGVDVSEGKPMNTIVMLPVMEGNLNWNEIIEAADKSGAKWAQVEQDNCNGEDPFECLKRSYENLKTKGFC